MIGTLHHRWWFKAVCAVVAGLMAYLVVPLQGRLLPRAEAGVGSQAKIYVFPYQPVFKNVPPEITTQATELLKNEIKHSEEVTLQKGPIFIPESAATPIKAMSDADLKAAEKLRKDGENFYGALKFAEAAKALQTAVNKYESSLALLQDFGPVVEALLMLSVCYYRLDNDDEGAKILVKVIRLQPDLVLDPEKYPPVFRNTTDALRKKLLLKARGELEVAANEEGAVVFFDGHKAGTTPILLKELVPGEHYIRVEKEGLQTWADKVTVVSTQRKPVLASLGGTKKAAGPLGEIADALQQNHLPTAVLDRVQEQGKEIGADFVVLGGIARVGNNYRVATFMVRMSNKEVCALPELQLDPDMLGASVEVYNMASTLFKKVEGCQEPITGGVIAVVQVARAKPTEVRAVAIGPAVPSTASGASGPANPSGPAIPGGPAKPALATTQPATGPENPRGPAVPANPHGPAVPGMGPAKPANPQPATGPAVVTTQEGLATTSGSALAGTQPAETVVPRNPIAEQVKPIDEVENHGPRWYASWWFWTIVGVVVVGGGVAGMYAGGVFNGGANGASVTVKWPPM